MPHMPSISSPGLILRAYHPPDAENLHAYLSDVNIYQIELGKSINLEQARKMAGELANSPDFWAVELRETGRVFGQNTLNMPARSTCKPDHGGRAAQNIREKTATFTPFDLSVTPK